ncbi:MAG: hypothetical protein ACYDDF_03315 [Thermoplasmatota archaeon]
MRQAIVSLALTLLIAPIFAGCLGNQNGPGATMGELLPTAQAAASQWQPGATLVAAVAGGSIHSSTGYYGQDTSSPSTGNASSTSNTSANSTNSLGFNGRAHEWVFVFLASNKVGAFVVAENRTIIARHTGTTNETTLKHAGFSLDSDKLVANVQANATWKRLLDNGSPTNFEYTLAHANATEAAKEGWGPNEVNIFTVAGSSGSAGAFAILNADSGAVLNVSGWHFYGRPSYGNFGPGNWSGFGGGSTTYFDQRHSGQLTVADASAKFPLPITVPGEQARIGVCYGSQEPAGQVVLDVKDASGQPVGTAHQGGTPVPAGPGVWTWSAGNLTPGTYTATLTLGPGLASDYRIHEHAWTGLDYSSMGNPYANYGDC